MLADVVLLCRSRQVPNRAKAAAGYNLCEKGDATLFLEVVSRGTLSSFLKKGSVPFSGVAHATDTDRFGAGHESGPGSWRLHQSAGQAAARQQREHAGSPRVPVEIEYRIAARIAERISIGFTGRFNPRFSVWFTSRFPVRFNSGFPVRSISVRYSGRRKERAGFCGSVGRPVSRPISRNGQRIGRQCSQRRKSWCSRQCSRQCSRYG